MLLPDNTSLILGLTFCKSILPFVTFNCPISYHSVKSIQIPERTHPFFPNPPMQHSIAVAGRRLTPRVEPSSTYHFSGRSPLDRSSSRQHKPVTATYREAGLSQLKLPRQLTNFSDSRGWSYLTHSAVVNGDKYFCSPNSVFLHQIVAT